MPKWNVGNSRHDLEQRSFQKQRHCCS
jgi:hypothetical protein